MVLQQLQDWVKLHFNEGDQYAREVLHSDGCEINENYWNAVSRDPSFSPLHNTTSSIHLLLTSLLLLYALTVYNMISCGDCIYALQSTLLLSDHFIPSSVVLNDK